MSTIRDIPHNLLIHILTETNDIAALGRFACTCREYNNTVLENKGHVMDRILASNSPYLIENLKFNGIDIEKDTDLKLTTFFDVVGHMKRVSEMKKKARYQHLLVKLYDQSLFKSLVGFEERTKQYERESKTLLVLTLLFNFAKFRLSQEKINMEVWAMYPIFEYVAMSLNNPHRAEDSIFADGILMKEKVIETRYTLKRYKDCSQDIKYRLGRLLDFIYDAYTSEDE